MLFSIEIGLELLPHAGYLWHLTLCYASQNIEQRNTCRVSSRTVSDKELHNYDNQISHILRRRAKS